MQTQHSEIKKQITKFTARQETELGYIKYKVWWEKNGNEYQYCVDVYTSTGLLIKTKLNLISKQKLLEFMENCGYNAG